MTYDENGNVLTYGDKEFTWNTGRHLESITDGDNTYSYTYDENGIRTSKTVNGITTYYNTKDGVILSQTDGTNTMYFQYDTSGTPLGFIYNGTQYFYITNQMGDVIVITEADGNIIAEYQYDEWGNVASTETVDEDNKTQIDVANANPLRYRGYYYDSETGYYYLQSRYYDPSICRFINSDIPEVAGISKDYTAGTNLFAYCNNNPVNNSDPSGHIAPAIVGGVISGIFAFLSYYLEYYLGMRKWNTIVLIALITANVLYGSLLWMWGFGGLLQKITKLAGIAQKLHMINKGIKNFLIIFKWLSKGMKFITNVLIKKFTRKPNESWLNLVKRILNNQTGVVI